VLRKTPDVPFGVLALLCVTGLFVFNPQVFLKENYAIYDIMQPLRRGNQQAPANLPVIVDIDRASANAFGRPTPRYVIADLLAKLASRGVAAIGVDINLSAPDMSSPAEVHRALLRHRGIDVSFAGVPEDLADYDLYLARVIARTPSVLAAYAERDSGRILSDVQGRPANVLVKNADANPDWLDIMHKRSGVIFPIAGLAEGNPVGLVDFAADRDGIVRRVPLLLAANGQPYPMLAVRTLMLAEKTEDMVLDIGPDGLESVTIGKYAIPLGRRGNIRFPFMPGKNNYDRVSAIDVVEDKVPKDMLEGRIVFVGSLSMLGINRVTKPSDVFYSTTELHAATIDAILSQNRIHTPKNAFEIQIVLILSAAALMIFVRRRYGFMIYLASTFGVAALAAGPFCALFARGLFLTPIWLAFTLSLMLFVNLCVSAVRNIYERNAIYRMFSNYVSSDVVRNLVRSDSYSIEGKEENLSIMFVDICRFVSISENMRPNDVVSLLNSFFTFTTDMVKKYHGTIDKFIGDAMLAFWNAPVAMDNHQNLAVMAALDMQRDIALLNKNMEKDFGVKIDISISVHSASTFVGNIGSKHLVNYTIIGDSVNFTSRMEAMYKVYGVRIVVSETVKVAVPGDEYYFQYLDKVIAFGKESAMKIYTVMYTRDAEKMKAELDKYNHAIMLYQSRNFAPALGEFRELLGMRPDSALYKLYISRAEHMIASPPPDDWNASFMFQNK
jgi:adenylate cyclase